MKKAFALRVVAILILAVVPALLMASPAYAFDFSDCASAGGTWSGLIDTGTCTYDASHALSIASCLPGESLEQEYVFGGLFTSTCIAASSSSSSSGETQTYTPIVLDEDITEPTTLVLGAGKNGSATFPPGTCQQKCSISAVLPAGAAGALPGDALATIYVRVVNDGGEPGEGSYTLCFSNPEGATLTIYRYLGGAWVAVAVGSSNPLCASGSGDGAFYLGS
ncbi:MAG: hypothetical protein WD751_01940 [Anaerolineales bacterium]